MRLAQNEPEEEARREGIADGDKIVGGFKDHRYIPTLARNPLMLSAICLVNFFEGGELPKDRAVLYKLCVEGLLHHWDQRRGIHSEFSLSEKLRTCRQVALAMQHDDRAEYEVAKVRKIFTAVLGNAASAKKRLEHIRYRTGLLIERRAGMFAFAHLTFQEYLAALAVYEGNRLGINAEQLAREHHDGRWNEVIALYCGLVPADTARDMIESLIVLLDTDKLSAVLTEAYLSAGAFLAQDRALRQKVLERIAKAPSDGGVINLLRFSLEEVAPIANEQVGRIDSSSSLSESYRWLYGNPNRIDWTSLIAQLSEWRRINPFQASEVNYLVHAFAPSNILIKVTSNPEFYASRGPRFTEGPEYNSQAEVAMMATIERAGRGGRSSTAVDVTLLEILRALSKTNKVIFGHPAYLNQVQEYFEKRKGSRAPKDSSTRAEFASLARTVAENFMKIKKPQAEAAAAALTSWADSLETTTAGRSKRKTKGKSGAKAAIKRTAKKPSKRRL